MSNISGIVSGSGGTSAQTITLQSDSPITVQTDSAGNVTGVTASAVASTPASTPDLMANPTPSPSLNSIVSSDVASLSSAVSSHAVASSYLTKGLLSAGFIWTNLGSQFSASTQKWVDIALIAAFTIEQYVFGSKA